MPMTRRGCGSASSGTKGMPMRMRWPIGSSFGQKRFAVVSLMMATSSELPLSVAAKRRPRASGMPSVSK